MYFVCLIIRLFFTYYIFKLYKCCDFFINIKGSLRNSFNNCNVFVRQFTICFEPIHNFSNSCFQQL